MIEVPLNMARGRKERKKRDKEEEFMVPDENVGNGNKKRDGLKRDGKMMYTLDEEARVFVLFLSLESINTLRLFYPNVHLNSTE